MKFVAALLFALPLCAAPQWLQIRSENFELFSDAGAGDARRTIEYFEQVRDFFMRTKSSDTTPRLPVTLVLFRNAKEYQPYSPFPFATAHFTGDENRDFIVMGGVTAEHSAVAVHEYMHLLVRHSGLRLPTWLNEGLAEVYSTLQPRGGQIVVGMVSKSRGYSLTQHKWLPLPLLLDSNHRSPEYNEKDRTSMFYAQSWLLTHMLMLKKEYRPDFSKFVLAVNDEKSSEAAFQSVYGKTLGDVNKDLEAYFRSDSLMASLYDMRLQKVKVDEPTEASQEATELLLARLVGLSGKYAESEQRLLALEAKGSTLPDIPEALGHIYWREGKLDKAREALGRAIERKPSSWKTYWDFARLSQSQPADDRTVRNALTTAIEMNPRLTDARLMLGYRYYRARQFGMALATLNEVKQLKPAEAVNFFLVRAHSALAMKDLEGAKSLTAQASKYAQTDRDRSEIASLTRYLEGRKGGTGETAKERNGPPQLRRQPQTEGLPESPLPASEAPEELKTVSGTLAEIDCSKDLIKLHVLSGQKIVVLLARDVEKVYINGASEEDQMLTCGSTRKPVSIEYVPNPDPKYGSDGDARGISYKKNP